MSTGRRKQHIGTVVTDKMDRSVVVAVQWTSRHRIYKKSRRRVTRFMTHDAENQATLGDIVRIEETRPLSRHKRWRLLEVIQTIEVAEVQPADVDPEAGADSEPEDQS